jgi:hypothetical protein
MVRPTPSGWGARSAGGTDWSDALVLRSAHGPERRPSRRVRAWTDRQCPSSASSAAARVLPVRAYARPMTGGIEGGWRRAGLRSPILRHRATTRERLRIVPLIRVLRRPPVRAQAPNRCALRRRGGGEKCSRARPNEGPRLPADGRALQCPPDTNHHNHRGSCVQPLAGVPLVMRRSRVRFPKVAPPPSPANSAYLNRVRHCLPPSCSIPTPGTPRNAPEHSGVRPQFGADEVPIEVHRHGGARMAENALNHFRVGASREPDRCGRVPQIVYPQRRPPDRPAGCVPVDGPLPVPFTQDVAGGAGEDPVRCQSGAAAARHDVDRRPGQRDRPGPVRLQVST